MQPLNCIIKHVSLVYKGKTLKVYYIKTGNVIHFWFMEKLEVELLPDRFLEDAFLLICESEGGIHWNACEFYLIDSCRSCEGLKKSQARCTEILLRPWEENTKLPIVWRFLPFEETDGRSRMAKAIKILIEATAEKHEE